MNFSEFYRVKVHIPQKAQLDPLEVSCVKFEDNRTSTFRDMLRKRIVHGRPNGPTAQRRNIIIFSSATLRIELRLKIFYPAIINLEVTHIPEIVILAFFLTKL